MKKILIAGILIALVLLGPALTAEAHKNQKFKGLSQFKGNETKGMGMQMMEMRDDKGSKNLSGEVVSVSATDITIKNRKDKQYTAQITPDTAIVNRVWDNINVADIQTGDKVQILGITKETATSSAKVIKDLSIPRAEEKMIVGKVSSVASSSLEITTKKQQYTVALDANDLIVNRIWEKISAGDIKTGDKIMIFGKVENTNIEAKMVRDLSLPKSSEE